MKTNRLYVDIHVLQTVPPSCINRDDTGSPKTAVYGGVNRARVSSQAWKYAMRKMFRKELLDEDEVGYRTKQVIDQVAKKIQKLDPNETEAAALAKRVLECAGIEEYKKGKNGTEETAALFFISAPQERALARLAVENRQKIKADFAPPKGADDDEKKKWKKEKDAFEKSCQKALQENPSVDQVLFGRMLAGEPSLNYDAAAQVAPSFSTHEVKNEYDYFTAMDDCKEDSDEQGAGHLDTKEFNSATLYRYATVNVRELARPESLGAERTPAAVRAFAEAFICSMPSGSQNSYANHTLADAVYITLHDDQPANFCNAFETAIPASKEGYIERSKKKFVEYAQGVYGIYLDKPIQAFAVGAGMEALAEPKPLKAVLSELEAAVAEQLTESEAN